MTEDFIWRLIQLYLFNYGKLAATQINDNKAQTLHLQIIRVLAVFKGEEELYNALQLV